MNIITFLVNGKQECFDPVNTWCDWPERVDCGNRPICDENDENCNTVSCFSFQNVALCFIFCYALNSCQKSYDKTYCSLPQLVLPHLDLLDLQLPQDRIDAHSMALVQWTKMDQDLTRQRVHVSNASVNAWLLDFIPRFAVSLDQSSMRSPNNAIFRLTCLIVNNLNFCDILILC